MTKVHYREINDEFNHAFDSAFTAVLAFCGLVWRGIYRRNRFVL